MENINKWLLVAKKIEEILQNGLQVGRDVQHYIDSTFSNPSLKDLEEIIKDDLNPERDALIELLFFPDESVKVQMEGVLEKGTFEKKDEEEIVAYLLAEKRDVALHFANDQGVLSLDMPASAVRQFVSRLNILRQLNARVIMAVDHHVDEKLRKPVKVRLRNKQGEMSENKISFLCSFFEKMRSQSRMFMKCVDFVLGFLDEIKGEKDIFAELINKKKFYFQNLQKAEKFEKQLRQSNMETLMMQGVKMVIINADEAREKMEIIDTICRAVFGRTEYFAPVGHGVDLGQFDQSDEIGDVIKKLS